ncbi:hypothetical protein PENTCL1PPCAC_15385, partial [Pristionchus entomophagus]
PPPPTPSPPLSLPLSPLIDCDLTTCPHHPLCITLISLKLYFLLLTPPLLLAVLIHLLSPVSHQSQFRLLLNLSLLSLLIPLILPPPSSILSQSALLSSHPIPPLLSLSTFHLLFLPFTLSSFHSSIHSIPAMSSIYHTTIDSQSANARLHLSLFLDNVQGPPPSLSSSHIVHCAKTRSMVLRAHALMESNGIGDMSPSLLSTLFSIHPQTVSRTINDSTYPLNRFPPCAPPPLMMTKKAVEERVKQRFSKETLEKLRSFIHREFFSQHKRMTLKGINDRKGDWIDERDENVAVSIPTIRLLLRSLNFSWVKLAG